jgi:hypothetical protein
MRRVDNSSTLFSTAPQHSLMLRVAAAAVDPELPLGNAID